MGVSDERGRSRALVAMLDGSALAPRPPRE
jgi:hypothetical protein